MITVFINGVICPTVEDDTILITKKIVDIENPEQKEATHSKSFLIENTAAVAALFGQIFEVNLDIQNTGAVNFVPDFNPNLKAKCVVMNDNLPGLSGYCQLTNIVVRDDNKIAYNINAYAELGNFFNEIKNSLLGDINFSDLNHNWTKAVIQASWTPTLGTGYVYPMIDYGIGTDYKNWNTLHFRPSVFVKEILDRIFTSVGWSYTSSFFTSTRFKSLVVPWSEEKMMNDATTLADRRFLVGNENLSYGSGNYNLPDSQSVILLDTATGAIDGYTLSNDAGANFNTGTGKWLCAANGNYSFGVRTEAFMTDGISGFTAATGQCHIAIVLERGGVRYIQESFELAFTSFVANVSTVTTLSETSQPLAVDIGDYIYLVAIGFEADDNFVSRISNANGDLDVTFNNILLNCIPSPELVYADTVEMDNLLPSDYKQTDFIMGLSKMFNLYFEQTEDKKLLIEPREDYLAADIVDWTTKIDIGQDVAYTPMGMNQHKRYKFTYEEDTDRLNNLYQTAYKEVYGTFKKDIVTDFLTETKEIKPIFAATPLANMGTDDKIISQMQFVDQNGAVKQGKSKLRILYWGGLLVCKNWNFYETPGLSPTTISNYPYAGHLDNPYSPAFDLCFGSPQNVYYDFNIGANGNVTYTDANLYTTYWHQTISEFTNRNSKILEAWFNLSVFDFVTLSFRKQYFIRNAYYRLLEVNDYDISGTQLVKCKLLKVSREAAYTTSSKALSGGILIFDGGTQVPVRLPVSKGKDDNTTRIDKQYEGGNNYINGLQTVVSGSGNRVPHSADKVYIFGSDNVNIRQAKVMVFNSDGQTVNRQGAIFNNVFLEYKQDTEVTAAYLQTIDASTQGTILPTLATNEHYEITKFYLVQGAGIAYAWVGTGDIELKSSTNVVGTILGANWLAGSENDITVGAVVTSQDFGEDITIEISGTYSSGSALMRIIIFYKIIQV